MSALLKIFKLIIIVTVLLILFLIGFIAFGPISSFDALVHALTGKTSESPSHDIVQQRLTTFKGYKITPIATQLGPIRFMAFSESGELVISRPRQGDVIILDPSQPREEHRILLSGLDRPHDLAFYKNWLFVAETSQVARYEFNHDQ